MSIGGNKIAVKPAHGVVQQSEATLTARPSLINPVQRVSTLPSYEAYVVDVPEVTNLKATFEYHYFVPDESVSETGEIPDQFLARSGESFDAATLDLMRTRVPRLINISFTPAMQSSVSSSPVTEAQQKEAAAAVGQTGNLIASHIAKIVSEDAYTSGRFVSVLFQDGDIEEKMYELVSGSYTQITLEQSTDSDASHYRAALQLSDALPSVDRIFITSNMSKSIMTHGARFLPFDGKAISVLPKEDQHVSIGLQIGSKVVHDVVERAVVDPHGHFAADMQPIRETAKKVQSKSRRLMNSSVTDDDYKVFAPYAFLHGTNANSMPTVQPAKIIGYIVDRQETLADGTVSTHEPIVIENPVVGATVDLKIKYGATYTYTVRTVASFTFPAIDDETGQIVMATVLVSSRPSNRARVKCVEHAAPPAPADVGFTWDYDAERMMVHWSFPPNTQRDIKRFQVFRRQTINEPYELIKMFDFDDSVLPIRQLERPEPTRVERIDNPRSWFTDEDFTRDTSYIYTLGSVDAHGNVSSYSAQFSVWFDRFKNKLMTRVLSHVGAPRQYPNMYLEADTFVDTIRDSGHHRLNVYFTPECYQVTDNLDRITQTVETDKSGGTYRLQFINPDVQKMGVVNIVLQDRRTQLTPV